MPYLDAQSVGRHSFWICAEILLLVAFLAGFYGVVHTNRDSGYDVKLMTLENEDVDPDTLKNAVRSLILSGTEAKICGIVALVCVCLSFIMVTVLSRALNIAAP